MSSGQNVKGAITPSDEQHLILASEANGIKINACPGAGKSQTLIMYSSARPDQRYLLLAYNNVIAEEARYKFPANVVCQTTHGIAFQAIGHVYDAAGKLGDPDVRSVCAVLSVQPVEGLCILKTLGAYLGSDDKEIGHQHVSRVLAKRIGASNDVDFDGIVAKANQLWLMMKNPECRQVAMPHDGYLKLYALSEPRLDLEFDGILIDEGQDSSGAVSGMLARQNCQRIIVGDRHQAINSWRGAVNAMETFPCDASFSLTKSFRYGSSIANVANKLLDFKGEKQRIQGTDRDDYPYETPAVICRTNASVLENAIRVTEAGKKIHLIGGFDSYRFGKILDVYQLSCGNTVAVNDPFIGSFRSFDEYHEYGVRSEDPEVQQLCRGVIERGEQLPEMIGLCKRLTVEDSIHAHLSLGTAHRTKGLEFTTVALENEFVDLSRVKPDAVASMTEEINLAHVACTRAKKTLFTSERLGRWLDGYVLAA